MGLPPRLGVRQLRILFQIISQAASLSQLRKTEKSNLVRDLKRLEEKGLLVLGGDIVKLSPRGRKLIREIELQNILIPVPKKWDGVWQVVAYDIPNDFKKERDYFRRKLKSLDFIQLQESMWLFPYPCKEEVAIITKSLNIHPFVIYLTTDRVPNSSKHKKSFNIH